MTSNNTIRLRTTPGEDKNIQVKLDQDFDMLEVLSLTITQEEAYNNFCSDYGVVAGRVIANDGFGIENAKVSIFIPLKQEDEDNDSITTLYPYTTVSDTNAQNIRYNLLPKDSKVIQYQQEEDCGLLPFTPEGLACLTTQPKFGDYRFCKIFENPQSNNADYRNIGDQSNWFLIQQTENCDNSILGDLDYCNLTLNEQNRILNESRERRDIGESQDYFYFNFSGITSLTNVFGLYFTIDSVNQGYYVWYNDTSGSAASDPNLPNRIGIEVRVPQNSSGSILIDYTKTAFRSVVTGTNSVTNSALNIDQGESGCQLGTVGCSSATISDGVCHNNNCQGPICDIEIFSSSIGVSDELWVRNVEFGESQNPPSLGTMSGTGLVIQYQPIISGINTTGNTLSDETGLYEEVFVELGLNDQYPLNNNSCQGLGCPPNIVDTQEQAKINWNERVNGFGFIPLTGESLFHRVDWAYYSGGTRLLDQTVTACTSAITVVTSAVTATTCVSFRVYNPLQEALSGNTFYTSNDRYSVVGQGINNERRCYDQERFTTVNSTGGTETAFCKYPIKIYKTSECDVGPVEPPETCISVGEPVGEWELLEDRCEIDGTALWGIDVDQGFGPNVPIGTFPSKKEVLDNDTVLEVYDKYYKYTTRTNASGDYMIFGVPVGIQTVHMDVDLSDIGSASLIPQDLINIGFPPNLFVSPSEFKSSTNLDSLAQIQSQNKSIEVIPFWGDTEQCEIGITRVDFNLVQEIVPSAVIIAGTFSNSRGGVGANCTSAQDENGGINNDNLASIGNMEYSPVVVKAIDNLGGVKRESFSDGIIVMSLPMYDSKKVTNEFGEIVDSPDGKKGIPTMGEYRFHLFLEEKQAPNQAPKGLYTAAYLNQTKAKLRYDLINKEKLIYTFGNRNFAKVTTAILNRGWYITGRRNLNSSPNDVAYPSLGTKGSAAANSNNSYFGEGETCYGSVFFPRFEIKSNGNFCDELITETGSGAEGEAYTYKDGSGIAVPFVMEITDVVPIFRKPGIKPTTANNEVWHLEDVILENGKTGYGKYDSSTCLSNCIPKELSNQTIPLYDSVELGNGILDRDAKEFVNENGVTVPINVVTKRASLSASNNVEYQDLSTEEERIQGRRTKAARYFMYFGLNDNNNALTKLKSKLGL